MTRGECIDRLDRIDRLFKSLDKVKARHCNKEGSKDDCFDCGGREVCRRLYQAIDRDFEAMDRAEKGGGVTMEFDLTSFLEEPRFADRFCEDCEAQRQDRETGYWDCPAGRDISDPKCCKAFKYAECLGILETAGRELGERVA